MTYEQTKEYLRMIAEMEKNKLIQEKTIADLKKKSASLGKSKKFVAPTQKEASADVKSHFLAWFVVFGIIGGIVSFLIFSKSHSNAGGIGNVFNNSIGAVGSAFVGMLVGGVFIGGLFAIITSLIGKATSQSGYSREYQNQMKVYNSNVESDNKRVFIEKIERKKINYEIEKVQIVYERHCNALNEMYAYDIIPQRFRSFIPVYMFYQYLEEKQTYSLERNPSTGDPGAIRIYIEDQYQEKIITRLDTIIDKLDEIIENQRAIYYAIKEVNQSVNRLNDNVMKCAMQIDKSIHEKTLIDHYDHEQLLEEERFRNNMDVIFGRWN